MLVLFYIYIYIYVYITNIPLIVIINRIYETQKSSVAVACFLPGRAEDLSAPLYNIFFYKTNQMHILHVHLVCFVKK